MKILITTLFLMITAGSSAHAGALILADASKITSYDYKHGRDCDSFTLGVEGTKYTFRFCVLQAMVQADLDALLTSPAQKECVKYENCRGSSCYREYGTRTENTQLLLILNSKNEIDSYKVKQTVGRCQ